MVLTRLADRKNSPSRGRPSTSSRTVCVRSPCATAAIARVTSAVGRSRSSTRVLTETSISPQAPLDSWNRVRSRVLPCLPTTWPTRFSSWAMCWLAATISLNVSATFPARPTQVPGRRTVKSPSRMYCRLVSMTVRSRDPSESFGFPLLDFPPLFFAIVGGGVPVLVGAVSLSAVLFIVSPEKRSTSNQEFPCNRFQPNRIFQGHRFHLRPSTLFWRSAKRRAAVRGHIPREPPRRFYPIFVSR